MWSLTVQYFAQGRFKMHTRGIEPATFRQQDAEAQAQGRKTGIFISTFLLFSCSNFAFPKTWNA